MIKITVEDDDSKLMKPEKMLTERWGHGTLFQMYDDGIPCNTYFIHCGLNEKNLIMIWYSEESDAYQLSTQNISSLKEYNSNVCVCVVNKNVDINLRNYI